MKLYPKQNMRLIIYCLMGLILGIIGLWLSMPHILVMGWFTILTAAIISALYEIKNMIGEDEDE